MVFFYLRDKTIGFQAECPVPESAYEVPQYVAIQSRVKHNKQNVSHIRRFIRMSD